MDNGFPSQSDLDELFDSLSRSGTVDEIRVFVTAIAGERTSMRHRRQFALRRGNTIAGPMSASRILWQCELAPIQSPSVGFRMPATNARRYVTSDEFLTRPAAAGPSELVRGEVRMMTPASGPHGVIAGTIFAALNAFVEPRQLGLCFPDNTGFLLPGLVDTVRSPDAAFIRAGQLPPEGIGPGWVAVAPDLVVEILSPNETASDVEEKLRDYRTAGTRLIWVIDPARRVVSVRDATAPDRWLSEIGTLDGGDVLPGFTISVGRLFARLAK